MRIIFAIIFVLCAIDAMSAEPTLNDSNTRGILSAGLGVVGEKSNDNRSMEARTLIAGRGGIEFGQHEVLLEVGGFKQQTGSSGVTVSRFHQQVDFWYHLLLFPSATIGHPYLGAAVGAQRDVVTTTFFGATEEATGAFEGQLSASAGYRFQIEDSFSIWVEGRLATSKNYEPSILPSALIFLGFRK